ncbi:MULTISPECIES: hypothetical protein [Vibrio]|uniref:hypothetical protein n=1 Tax=Vibrio TaxID=662 RepID=UPI001E50559A|nr:MULTISPECIES: hypothetical protein [Vibrio]MCC2524949.1 hypothetical protein [Vibrio coralliilyticus]USD35494.1 hypothetical protein J8Z27_23020 [Vibrio sp. SCSIO 43186]USD72618.1 hypothetical protein J4N41_23025 [Vibrio sp. SCSIO 43139]USD99009.1 hypothetical protein CTT30_23335 [Vibrio coralliilyticus]
MTQNNRLSLKLSLFVSLTLCAFSAYAATMTVEEVESERIRIMESDRNNDEKIKAIKALHTLAKESIKLQELLYGNQNRPTATEAPPQQANSVNIVKYELPKGWNLNTVFVSELFGIGDDFTAELYVDGERIPNVDLFTAKENGEAFGSFIIVDYTASSIAFKNKETNQTLVRRVVSAEQIIKQVEHNNKLREQYQEKYTLGKLDAELKSFTESANTPVQVSYQTQSRSPVPVNYDTMKGE